MDFDLEDLYRDFRWKFQKQCDMLLLKKKCYICINCFDLKSKDVNKKSEY